MCRYRFLVWFALLIPGKAIAALDAESQVPYHFRVVIRYGDDRMLGPYFKRQVQRDIHDAFQAALGPMGLVEVLDAEELPDRKAHAKGPKAESLGRTLTLSREVQKNGLRQALDGWHEISNLKTHFVLIDFHNGLYEIQTRQFDGLTGLPSPEPRSDRVLDRQIVGRAASLLMDRDFGLVGTIVGQSTGAEVKVVFKSSGLGSGLINWAKKGNVFAIALLRQIGKIQAGSRVEDALLQLLEDPHAGDCRCRLLARYQHSIQGGDSVLGYRCLKLGTTTAPLRLQLLDDKTRRPLSAAVFRVSVSPGDFGADPKEESSLSADGIVRTRANYTHVAFVRVFNGARARAEIPVEILGDHPVIRTLAADPTLERVGRLDQLKKMFLRKIGDSLLSGGELVKRLNQSEAGKSRDVLLGEAQAGLTQLKNDYETFQLDLAAIRDQGRALGLANYDLAEMEFAGGQLKDITDNVNRYIINLTQVIQQERDPARQKVLELVERARLSEGAAEYDMAISLYEEALRAGATLPGIKEKYAQHLDQLKKEWTPRSEAHREARAFLLTVWPKLDSARKLKDQMNVARKMFQICREAHDKKTSLILLKANTAHATFLAKRLEMIESSTQSVDNEEKRLIVEVTSDLKKLTEEARAVINGTRK